MYHCQIRLRIRVWNNICINRIMGNIRYGNEKNDLFDSVEYRVIHPPTRQQGILKLRFVCTCFYIETTVFRSQSIVWKRCVHSVNTLRVFQMHFWPHCGAFTPGLFSMATVWWHGGAKTLTFTPLPQCGNYLKSTVYWYCGVFTLGLYMYVWIKFLTLCHKSQVNTMEFYLLEKSALKKCSSLCLNTHCV